MNLQLARSISLHSTRADDDRDYAPTDEPFLAPPPRDRWPAPRKIIGESDLPKLLRRYGF